MRSNFIIFQFISRYVPIITMKFGGIEFDLSYAPIKRYPTRLPMVFEFYLFNLDDNGEPREYIINPYQIVAANGRYYLICNYDKYDDLANYRLDRITDIELLETPRKPKNKVQGLVGLDIAQYMNEHIYMFTGKSVRAKFEAPKYLISDILDYFKADVNFKELENDQVLATVKVNETDMQLWARQYCGQIKIIEPQSLSEACKQDILDALALYEE